MDIIQGPFETSLLFHSTGVIGLYDESGRRQDQCYGLSRVMKITCFDS
jgi:hypothetical protein